MSSSLHRFTVLWFTLPPCRLEVAKAEQWHVAGRWRRLYIRVGWWCCCYVLLFPLPVSSSACRRSPRMTSFSPGRGPWFTKEHGQSCGEEHPDAVMMEIHLPRKEVYLQRVVEEASLTAGRRLSANISARLWLCLPRRCTSDGPLLRLVVHRALLRYLGLCPPLPRALQPSELRWKLSDGTLPLPPPAEAEDLAQKGRCLCSQDVGDRYQLPAGLFSVREVRELMQDLQKPGIRRQRALGRIRLPHALSKRTLLQVRRHAPKNCYNSYQLDPSEGRCTAAALSRSLLRSVAAAASQQKLPQSCKTAPGRCSMTLHAMVVWHLLEASAQPTCLQRYGLFMQLILQGEKSFRIRCPGPVKI